MSFLFYKTSYKMLVQKMRPKVYHIYQTGRPTNFTKLIRRWIMRYQLPRPAVTACKVEFFLYAGGAYRVRRTRRLYNLFRYHFLTCALYVFQVGLLVDNGIKTTSPSSSDPRDFLALTDLERYIVLLIQLKLLYKLL